MHFELYAKGVGCKLHGLRHIHREIARCLKLWTGRRSDGSDWPRQCDGVCPDISWIEIKNVIKCCRLCLPPVERVFISISTEQLSNSSYDGAVIELPINDCAWRNERRNKY